MIHPEHKIAITKKIKATAKRRKEFRAFDCMSRHLGEHQSADWAEVAESLVDSGYLTGKGKGFTSRLYQRRNR